MNKLRNIAVALPVVFSMGTAVAAVAPVSAATTTSTATTCSVKAVGTTDVLGKANSRFVLNKDGTVTATFKVTGNDNCKQGVVMAAWEAPNGKKGMPYTAQKLETVSKGTFGVGTHALTVKLPTCYYQIDLVRGTASTDANGGPVYGTANMMGSIHGGTQVCGGGGGGNIPTPTPTPKTPVAPTVLPNTGTGTNILVAALSAGVIGTAFQYVRQLRAARSFNQ